MLSWISETIAWFVAIERPVTIAWSTVGRGMSVRWNVSGHVRRRQQHPGLIRPMAE